MQEQAGGLPIITEHLHFVNNENGTYLALSDDDLKYFASIVKNCADPHTPSSWKKVMEGSNWEKCVEGINKEIAFPHCEQCR